MTELEFENYQQKRREYRLNGNYYKRREEDKARSQEINFKRIDYVSNYEVVIF